MRRLLRHCFVVLLAGLGLLGDAFALEKPARRVQLAEVRVQGAGHISRGDLKRLGLGKADHVEVASLQQKAQALIGLLRDEGYYFAALDSLVYDYSADSTRLDLTVYVDAGKCVKINSLQILGLPSAYASLREDLASQAGQVFDPNRLEEDIDFILRHFEERGYPYCQVEIGALRLAENHTARELSEQQETDARSEPAGGNGRSHRPEAGGREENVGIDIQLNVETGPEVRIETVEVVGNEQTRSYVITREMGITEGRLYDQRQVDEVVTRLMRTGYFKWVNAPQLFMQPDGSGKLRVELQEGHHNRFDGVIGYNPGVGSEPGFLTGFLNVSFLNLLGTGRQIEASWQRKSKETQELNIRYLEPWVAGLPVDIGFEFSQLLRDTSYVDRRIGLDAALRFGDNLKLFTRISTVNIAPDSLAAIRFGIPPSNSINLRLGFALSTIDSPLNPTRGMSYQTTVELARKSTQAGFESPDSESFSQEKLSVDLETYLSPLRWQVFAVGVHGRTISSSEAFIGVPDQYRLGGTRTLRGYREDQFRGERAVWANLEYRYLLNEDSRLFVFCDLGHFFRKEQVLEKVVEVSDFKIGYGFGLRLSTKLGHFGLDYGIGEDDSLSNGKIHIGLRNAF